ncbi:MAG: WD40 repeat domain-containing protein, partial [Planctomycetota bacterium]
VDEGTPHVIFGLSADDGRILWRRPLVTGWWQPKPRQVKGYSVLDGRLVIYATHMLSVIDVDTGRLLMDLPQRREMVRRSWSSSQDVEAKLAVAGNAVLVGFENLIEAVDLTPTADLPRELRAGDPASVGGANMADTPDEGEKLRRSLPGVLYRTRGGKRVPDRQRIMELYWLDDEAVVEAMLALLRAEELWLRDGEPMIIASFVGHPNEERGIAALRKVVEGPGAYPLKIRRMAKEQLELMGVPEEAESRRPAPASAPAAEILYSGDSEKAVIWFRERLLSQDVDTRRAALEGLKLAADKVIVAIEAELGRMPEEEERAAGGKLVHDAEQRLAAMRRFQTKKMAAGVRPPVPKPETLDLTGRALVPALPPDEPPPIVLVADDDTRLPAGAVCRVGTPGKGPAMPDLDSALAGQGIREHIKLAALSYDGRFLATVRHHGNAIRIWDVTQGKFTRALEGHERNHEVRALRFSPDGRVLASADGGIMGTGTSRPRVCLWSADTWELMRTLRPKEWSFGFKSIAFSADGRRIAVAGGAGAACVREVDTGRELRKLSYDDCGWFEPVGLGPEGKVLMTRGPNPPRTRMRKSPAILWDVETGRKLRTLAEDRVQARFALSPDGTILASRSTKGVELIDSNAGSVLALRKRFYLPIVFSPDGRTLACTQGGGRIHLLDVATGHAWHVFEGGQKHTTCISFSGDGGSLASAHSDGTAFVWKVPDRPMGTSAAPADD